ncbi:MAG: hypothetical protein JKX92_06750 [Porticoccaceae bacterium]|nr:hypothetical protein [Porticoccaceae bacterium]
MARIVFDFEKKDQDDSYPSHGWAINSQGIKLLWLPLLHLVKEAGEIRGRHGIEKKLTRVHIEEITCFPDHVKKLHLALRELHRSIVLVASCGGFDNPKNDTEGVGQTIPLYVDLIYIYLRRLADHFTRAIRFSVFEHFESAPREFKKLRKMNSSSLKALKPLVDIDNFISAIQDNDDWFDILRSEGTKKGLRDSLEHHPTSIQIQSSGNGDGPWKVDAYLMSGNTYRNLLDPISSMVNEVCTMFTAVHKTIACGGSYNPRGDCIFIPGADHDCTGFWPEISPTKA